MISVLARSIRNSLYLNRNVIQSRYAVHHNVLNTVRYSISADIANKRANPESAPANICAGFDQIRSHVAFKERIQYETLKDFVESLNEPITTEQISFLYECIGWYLPQVSAQLKADLIAKLWTKVKAWKSPSQDDFVSWLKALRQSGANVVWEELKSEIDNIEPGMKVYEELLYLVGSNGHSQQSVQVLALIKEQDYPLTEKIFNALIVAHSRDKNVSAFESILELMSSANLTPNEETQFEMARAYACNGLWENAEEIIDLSNFSTRQILELVKSVLSDTEDVEVEKRIAKLLQKLPSDVLKHREISPIIRNFLVEQIHIFNRPQDALKILKSLPTLSKGLCENEDSYGAFLLQELIITQQPFAVIKSFCDFLMGEGRNPRAAFVCTEISLRYQSTHSLDLLRLLATMESLKPHYFWPLFIREYQINGEQGVIDLIVEMKTLNVKPDADTINIYILPRVALILKDIKNGLQLITDSGIEMSFLMGPLLLNLMSNSRHQDFELVLNTYPSKISGDQFITPLAKYVTVKSVPKEILRILKVLIDRSQLPPNTDLNGSLLVELATVGKFVPLQFIAEEMVKHKIKISQAAKSRIEERIKTAKSLTVDLRKPLLEAFNKIQVDGSVPLAGASYLESKHPKDMNFNELESHLAELEGKQLNTRGILRKLLQMAIREKRYDRALQLKEKCDTLQMDYSPGMLASCVELYTQSKRIDEAKSAWYDLERKFPAFVVDEFKVIDFAAFLISQDQLEEAKAVLEKRAKQKVHGDNNNKNIWHLLTVVCDKSVKMGCQDNMAKSFFSFLVQHKYCRYSNTLLGPIIRECLMKGELRKAVEEYKDMAKNYRKTPLNLELLTILVGLKNGQPSEYGEFSEDELMKMIGDVFKCVEEIHGLAAAKTSLLFATAEGGTDKQVRKILMDPNVRIDAQALHRQCEYLSRAGKTEPLYKLITSCRGLSHNIIDEKQLWCALMQTLAKQNDVEEAVRLFDRLLEEDEFKVNQQVAEIVIDLLKRNNLELPSRLQTFNK